MTADTPPSILIADPDSDFLAKLRESAPGSGVKPHFVSHGKDVQAAVGDPKNNFSALFINPGIKDPFGIQVIRFCHTAKPLLPIYLLEEGEPIKLTDELKRHGVRSTIRKPCGLEDLTRLLATALTQFNPEAAIAQAKRDHASPALKEDASAYFAIKPDDFMAGTKSYFDLFICLASTKFLKIVEAGDEFPVDRFKNYLKKGVTEFYIRTTVRDQYLAYRATLAKAVLGSDKVSLSTKVNATLTQGAETLGFLKKQGMSDRELQAASQFVANTRSLVDQMDLSKMGDLSSFMSNMAAHEHGVSTSMIASLLAKELGFDAEKTVKIVGLASLFHDVGLYKVFPGVEAPPEDMKKMTPEQKAIYVTHPKVGADSLKDMPGMEEIILQAVALHHQRRHKHGFPAREHGAQMNRVAEIVGIADEFSMLIQRAAKNPNLNLKEELEFDISHGFSLQVVKAFKKIFFPEKG